MHGTMTLTRSRKTLPLDLSGAALSGPASGFIVSVVIGRFTKISHFDSCGLVCPMGAMLRSQSAKRRKSSATPESGQ